MKILQLTSFFRPNVGGVETHLDDLCNGLSKLDIEVLVLTYKPLMTKARYEIYERKGLQKIIRLPWISGLFNALMKYPLLEFIYLSLGLFLAYPFAILAFRPSTVHAHGIVPGFVGVVWNFIFRKKLIISTHSTYNLNKASVQGRLARWVFSSANNTICLSEKSMTELITLGVSRDKLSKFVYWIDLKKFTQLSKEKCRTKLAIDSKSFIVLYVGRLVEEKGVNELLSSLPLLNSNVRILIAGSGPMEEMVSKVSSKKMQFCGKISQELLPFYYSAADVLIVPSTHDEGFGRVIIEALACGLPVIASNRGGIPEAVNNEVAELITVNPSSIAKSVNEASANKKKIHEMSKKSRSYAVKRYGPNNISLITKYYV